MWRPRFLLNRLILPAVLSAAALWGACSSPSSESERVRAEVAADVPPQCDSKLGLKLYERRIAPLFEDDRPKSCSQCHLSGLDLSLYVRDSACETFACLKDRGLIDIDDPDNSAILGWIDRAEPESTLITERVLAEEYEGFRQWIAYNARCDTCKKTRCGGAEEATFCRGSPEAKDFDGKAVDPGGCAPAELETLFQKTVYATRGRCSPCHYNDHEQTKNDLAPPWLDVKGTCTEGVTRTLQNVVARDLIDIEHPSESLLLLKPLDEKLGGVPHGGHAKFYSTTRDNAYLAFLYFIERYSACQRPPL